MAQPIYDEDGPLEEYLRRASGTTDVIRDDADSKCSFWRVRGHAGNVARIRAQR